MAKRRQGPQVRIYLQSKRGRQITAGGRCFVCRKDYRIVWRYSASDVGTVDLCDDCKAQALDRSFGRIDALDLPHEGGQFEANRRRH